MSRTRALGATAHQSPLLFRRESPAHEGRQQIQGRRGGDFHGAKGWQRKSAQSPAATAASAGSAAEAVIGSEDVAFADGLRRDIPKEQLLAAAELHPEHLVEVAVKDFARHADVDGAAAHQAIDRGGIEAVRQQIHVTIPLSLFAQVSGKAGNGQIGDGEQAREDGQVVQSRELGTLALLLTAWGALTTLGQARAPELRQLFYEPIWDPWRDDPRFLAALAGSLRGAGSKNGPTDR